MREKIYEDDDFRIDRVKEGHLVNIHGLDYFIQDGVYQDLSRIPRQKLKDKLDLINPHINSWLDKKNLTSLDLGVVFAQAKINELEEELDRAYIKILDLKFLRK